MDRRRCRYRELNFDKIDDFKEVAETVNV